MFFKGRQLLIATKHGKENVVAPILEKELGVTCIVANKLDTDILGTFSGEIERTLTPEEAARQKCKLAMEIYNCDLCLASEGSFGPHPVMHFIPANEELLLLTDTKNNLEISARELSTATNFNAEEIKDENQLSEFTKRALFPTHALILRPPGAQWSEIEKGINTKTSLKKHFRRFLKTYGAVHVETDMRAFFNPSRMLVIESATKTLAKQIKTTCPQCQRPGFGIATIETGLLCKLCKLPTRSILNYVYSCKGCGYSQTQARPDHKQFEDPIYCDYCNP